MTTAFFSDETKQYRTPTFVKANDKMTVRLRTVKELSCAPLFLCDLFQEEMKPVSDEQWRSDSCDYYECTITVPSYRITYCFKVLYEDRYWYYSKSGLKEFRDSGDEFVIVPDFGVPEWAIGAVMYQIFPDRFYNGGKNNDVRNAEYIYADKPVERVFDWNSSVADLDVHRFYGGDLMGVRKKLDYLKGLGVDVIYLNPVFVSPSNHKYDCQDYDHIDPHLTVITKDVGMEGVIGNNRYVISTTYKENLEKSNEFFADFVKDVHAHGMKVILDGVFNHCGSFNKWMDKEGYYSSDDVHEAGAYRHPESPYREFFRFDDDFPEASYEGWWGFDTLPKLNYEASEKLCEYICNIGAKWVSEPYNVDGWRLDVAADLGHSEEFNHSFWKRFRKAVKKANPNAVILAEHYGDASAWLRGDEWDTIMNYDAFMEPLTWFLTGMEKHGDAYKGFLINNTDNLLNGLFDKAKGFSYGTWYSAMNELSNHDHSRFLTRTNHMVGRVAELGAEAASKEIRKDIFMEAIVFQMTWPGCPTIYYGDEAGLVGFTDPDSRRTYPWGSEDKMLISLYTELGSFRKALSVLRFGSVAVLAKEEGVIVFARFDRNNAVIVGLNNTDSDRTVHFLTEPLDLFTSTFVTLLSTSNEGLDHSARFIYDNEVFIRAHGSVVLKNH